jgi:hypothetical protein
MWYWGAGVSGEPPISRPGRKKNNKEVRKLPNFTTSQFS